MDHIWYNRFNNIDSGILLIGITDHLPTFLIINHVTYSENNFIRVQFRDHSRSNVDLFTDACGGVNWNSLTNDVNGDTLIFKETIDKLYRKYFPLKIKYLSQKRLDKPWLTPAILKSIKVKSQYYKKFKLNLITEAVYKRFKNKLTNIIKKVKRDYNFHKFSNCKKDTRSTWKHLHQLILNRDSKRDVHRLVVDDSELTDERDISEYFNDYFSGIAGKLNSSIPPPVNDPLENLSRGNHSNSLFLYPVTCSEVTNVSLNLKNSSYGLNCIPTKIFKSAINYLALPLSVIINNSIAQGIFPDILKNASVIPIYKSGSSTDVNNYRPISILPLLSKIFEKCVNIRVVNYLEKYNILSINQFGFRKSKNTTDAVSSFIEYVYRALNSKEHVLGISIDLRKAFDTVNHEILI